MNMIEKATRAFCTKLWGKPVSDVTWIQFEPAMRAAIEAMRDPSSEMIKAAEENLFEHLPNAREWTMTCAKEAYEAAIDAALKEE